MPNKQLILGHTPECDKKDFKSVLASDDFDDVQGDILIPFPKRTEDFLFFEIKDSAGFREALANLIKQGRISSTNKVKQDREEIARWKDTNQEGLKVVENMNISFTFNGLKKLSEDLGLKLDGLPDSGRKILEKGQLKDAASLRDLLEDRKDNPKDEISRGWDKVFKDNHDRIHGVLLVACESTQTVEKSTAELKGILGKHTEIIHQIHGDTRSEQKENGESLKDHEHFGWKDGISNPWLKNVFCECRKVPGQPDIEPGVILVGHPTTDDKNNELLDNHWARNGSYLVFRKIDQLVPEFDKWLQANPVPLNPLNFPELSDEELKKLAVELRGAQLVGRWKKGTPLELSPRGDDPKIADNPREINNFKFKLGDRTVCPFSAHIRKMNPRDPQEFGKNFIVRAGITYGKEVQDDEKKDKRTKLSRGLAFVSYQSDINKGFRFQQMSWANNEVFPPTGRNQAGTLEFNTTGLDPLIGHPDKSKPHPTTLDTAGKPLTLEQFVIGRGGVYCFAPPVKTLKIIAGMRKV
ncbi:unnamed protein product [Rhizoctonia solani]|uniref:Uncharacterized protein n=1 Tax=Rhizoctonia solani TaxID=456999 RepID=A0A8H3BIC6_9AGAM|nr:unnamed protein product [Rhizoctonia solani]